jgi:hypothetical protein
MRLSLTIVLQKRKEKGGKSLEVSNKRNTGQLKKKSRERPGHKEKKKKKGREEGRSRERW